MVSILTSHTFLFVRQGLMAIHCAAIQGRHDAIKELLNNDPDETIKRELAVESEVKAFCSSRGDNII